MDQEERYEVDVTTPARNRYQGEVLSYLIEHFSIERVMEIDDDITETVQTLSKMPERGRDEELLSGNTQRFKFILYKETRNLEIKIIYYIDQPAKKVYVTDLFPVLMNPAKLRKRN